MSRAGIFLLASLLAAPVVAYLVYGLARGLGFLDPPVSRQHELRRSILAALYALLILFPVFLFGWERRWPRIWIAFGVVCGAALVFFAVSGAAAARELWRVRHEEEGTGVSGEARGAQPESDSGEAPLLP